MFIKNNVQVFIKSESWCGIFLILHNVPGNRFWMQTAALETEKRPAKNGMAIVKSKYFYKFSIAAEIVIIKAKQCVIFFSESFFFNDLIIQSAYPCKVAGN